MNTEIYLYHSKFTFHYGSILIIPYTYYIRPDDIFTFHYGSILIDCMLDIFLKFFLFTFHYGSILIILWFWAGYILFFIYIPLWFYSNPINFKISRTQHIYIPLWFYSNLCEALSSRYIHIYIPLWFYSNKKILCKICLKIHLHSTMVLF